MTMRALAARVGLRQPSLYAYLDSKLGIYDAQIPPLCRQGVPAGR